MTLNLDPSTLANIDQVHQASRDYIKTAKEEFRRFKKNHPELTKAEIIYILFDAFQQVMDREQAISLFTVCLVDYIE